MGKYEPLRRFLRRRRGEEVELSFADIERIIGALLPKTANDPVWWTNQPQRGRGFVQCGAWLEAGFHARPAGGETVRFLPMRQTDRQVDALDIRVPGGGS